MYVVSTGPVLIHTLYMYVVSTGPVMIHTLYMYVVSTGPVMIHTLYMYVVSTGPVMIHTLYMYVVSTGPVMIEDGRSCLPQTVSSEFASDPPETMSRVSVPSTFRDQSYVSVTDRSLIGFVEWRGCEEIVVEKTDRSEDLWNGGAVRR